tara:strand:- start:584 stop:967 length:384 start_codon:yes stop_codon:yes gene_type:complete
MKQIHNYSINTVSNESYIEYDGYCDYEITLRIDDTNRLWLDHYKSGEESGMILKELIHVIKELIKLNFINNSTKFHLVAMDLNYENGLDNLVRYYDRIGFWIDSYNNSTDENTLSMMTTISHFINVN